MYLIRLYRDKLRADTYWEAEDLTLAREGFEQVKSGLGNPHLTWNFPIVLGGREIGETTFRLSGLDRVELVELVVTGERLLDSHELSEQE